jgi:hypothetical protein
MPYQCKLTMFSHVCTYSKFMGRMWVGLESSQQTADESFARKGDT